MALEHNDGLVKAVRCSCYSEAVLVEADPEVGLAYLAVMTLYGNFPLSLWDRIRHCWRILRSGKPYTDMMCLDKKRIANLVSLLQEASAKLSDSCDDEKLPAPSIAEPNCLDLTTIM